MTVGLCHARSIPPGQAYDFWLAVTGTPAALPAEKMWGDVAVRLEDAYNDCADVCVETGLALAQQPGSEIARTPTMGAYGTDFRLMVAWVKLAAELARQPQRFLIVCDDPWLFREIAALEGVSAANAPSIRKARTRLRLRGTFARCKNAVRLATAWFRLRKQRRNVAKDRPAILVYGHPGSDAAGKDAYFGDLMAHEPDVQRLLHTDCEADLAQTLSGRSTASLHAWGGPFLALSLVATKWRPRVSAEMPYSHLVARAVEIENSGAGPMMTRWQTGCQARWIRSEYPTVICWPWENFAWERELCRAAKCQQIPTAGYQHTVVGIHQINFRADLNPDPTDSLPDRIICNGPGYRQELIDWGHDAGKLPIGGAFRVARPKPIAFDRSAPVYFALSGLVPIAWEQIRAARTVAESGHRVVFRDHPMYPMDIDENENLKRADTGLLAQDALSAVVYSTGTSGLEALLAGLPTIRFQPDDRVAVQILPAAVKVPTATRFTINQALDSACAPQHLSWENIFSPVDYEVWHALLNGMDKSPANSLA